MNGINIEFNCTRPARSLPKLVFVVASLTLLSGFLISFSSMILDVLWICSFCLTGAAIVICSATRSSSDLIGFVPLMWGLTLLRLVAEAGTARRIIQNESAGILISSVGSALGSIWPLGVAFICLLMAVIIVVIVFAACQRTTLASTNYLERILPLKRMGIETDLRLGVIDENQANMLYRRIVAENRFFAGMNGTALLMRAEAAVCIFILLACLVIPTSNAVSNQSSSVALLAGIGSAVSALSVFTLIPALMIAVACGTLMSRDTLILRTDGRDKPVPPQTPMIKVVSLDIDSAESAGPLNTVFSHSKEAEEQIAEFEPPADGFLPSPLDISCRNAKEYYEKLSQVICKFDSQPRVVLLASDRIHSLPVTVAVNIAIRLAQKKQKVLLVDGDIERNALAHVFNLDPRQMQKKVQSSCFENLSVCSVSAEKLNKLLQKKDIFNHFGTTLIYAPNVARMKASKDAVKPGVFFFINSQDWDGPVEKPDFCGWFCLIPSLQSVLDSKQPVRA